METRSGSITCYISVTNTAFNITYVIISVCIRVYTRSKSSTCHELRADLVLQQSPEQIRHSADPACWHRSAEARLTSFPVVKIGLIVIKNK